MGEVEKIEKIKKIKELMVDKAKIQPDQKIEGSQRNSPIEELREISASRKTTRVTPAELIAQTQEAINKMEEIKGTLRTPDAQLKDSLTPLLTNKLDHIDENLRTAMSKSGSEYVPRAVAPEVNPITRFLGFLTDGQYKLQTIASDVERMHLNKEEINPAAMLSIQIKVGLITQELEFFSGLLNKALESTKTIMNVQV
jgi:hypothetical protein